MNNNIFDCLYTNWWDEKKICKPLHILNKIRFDYINDANNLKNKTVLDIGCGGGLLTEKLCLHGAIVTGIDKSKLLIKIAENHSNFTKNLTYINIDINNLYHHNLNKYDIITCMEVMEHLNDQNILFKLLNKLSTDNTIIYLSSINKHLISYIKMILLGEYVSKKIIKNTHNFNNFNSLVALKYNLGKFNLKIIDIKFIQYNSVVNVARLFKQITYNYIIMIQSC